MENKRKGYAETDMMLSLPLEGKVANATLTKYKQGLSVQSRPASPAAMHFAPVAFDG